MGLNLYSVVKGVNLIIILRKREVTNETLEENNSKDFSFNNHMLLNY